MRELLRSIPKVDDILRHDDWPRFTGPYPERVAREALDAVLNDLRAGIKAGAVKAVTPVGAIIAQAHARARAAFTPHLRRVVNGTGVIIHTNLGRSLLPPSAIKDMAGAGSHYSNLEYDLERGERGDRYRHCTALITKITGAEAALVVNNNAAAVYLVLNTIAEGREVVVSRGELVEIGGSFRVPDVMRKSGCILREVGTTNRTYAADYERVLTEETALLARVHTSNFRVRGFVHAPTGEEIVALGRTHGIATYLDAGSGLLVPLPGIGHHDEPVIPEEVRKGYDIVSFSGDKLLGGPQSGIIVGRRDLISAMRTNPLTRALRPDKFTLAALEGTLLFYLDPDMARREIPTLRMMLAGVPELRQRTQRLMRRLSARAVAIDIEGRGLLSEVGGGTLPDVTIPSYGMALKPRGVTATEFDRRLRHLDVPIVGRIEHDTVLIDIRTVLPGDEPFIVSGIEHALKE